MLLMLPCAGGCAANYSKYKKYLDEVIVYEYPGHWTRYDEPLKSSMKSLAEAIAEEIIFSHYSSKIFLFGHSMGGLVAWYIAKNLQQRNVNIAGLFIAACHTPRQRADFFPKSNDAPPQVTENITELVKSDEEIKAFLKKIRQVPEKILDSYFFDKNLLPVIRNDFRIIQEQTDDQFELFKNNRLLSVPIICFSGTNDPIVNCADMEQWKNFTDNQFAIYSCIGDHFFVYDDENIQFVCKTISRVIST